MKFGNSGLCLAERIIDFLRSGTKPARKKQLLSQHTDLLKKTDKTPVAELEKAEKIRKLYFERKNNER